MKKLFKWIVSAILATCAFGAHAQIPVTDAGSIAQMLQQVVQLKNQVEEQKRLYSAMSGGRGLGNLLNNPQLMNSLPDDWRQVYMSLQSGGYSGLTGSAKAIRDATRIFNCEGKVGPALQLCNRELNKPAQDRAYASDAYDKSQQRLNNIQGLMGQIDQTQDPKAIQDLQARIQTENAMIQNEQTKLALFKMMSDAEDRAIQTQKHEIEMQRASRRTRTVETLQPIQY